MRIIVATALTCLALYAQSPGTITETNLRTVKAVAGTVSCTFTNPAPPAFHAECSENGTAKLSMDVTPAVGAANGAAGSFMDSGNSVTWLVQQPTAGTVTYQIAANGTSKSGTF